MITTTLTDKRLNEIRNNFDEKVHQFTKSDLQDPALNGEYWQLCRELDEVDQEISECRKGEKTNENQ